MGLTYTAEISYVWNGQVSSSCSCAHGVEHACLLLKHRLSCCSAKPPRSCVAPADLHIGTSVGQHKQNVQAPIIRLPVLFYHLCCDVLTVRAGAGCLRHIWKQQQAGPSAFITSVRQGAPACAVWHGTMAAGGQA